VFVVCDDYSLSLSRDKDDIMCLGVPFNLIDVVEKGSSDSQKPSFPQQMRLPKWSRCFLSRMTRISIDLTGALGTMKEKKVEGRVSKASSLTVCDGSVARESQFFRVNGCRGTSKSALCHWRRLACLSEGTKKRSVCVLCFTFSKQ
jgi:hypothetical protein